MPQAPSWWISTRPSSAVVPPTKRISASGGGPGTVVSAPWLSCTPSAVHTPPASHGVPSAGSDTVTSSPPAGVTRIVNSVAPSAVLSTRRIPVTVPLVSTSRWWRKCLHERADPGAELQRQRELGRPVVRGGNVLEPGGERRVVRLRAPLARRRPPAGALRVPGQHLHLVGRVRRQPRDRRRGRRSRVRPVREGTGRAGAVLEVVVGQRGSPGVRRRAPGHRERRTGRPRHRRGRWRVRRFVDVRHRDRHRDRRAAAVAVRHAHRHRPACTRLVVQHRSRPQLPRRPLDGEARGIRAGEVVGQRVAVVVRRRHRRADRHADRRVLRYRTRRTGSVVELGLLVRPRRHDERRRTGLSLVAQAHRRRVARGQRRLVVGGVQRGRVGVQPRLVPRERVGTAASVVERQDLARPLQHEAAERVPAVAGPKRHAARRGSDDLHAPGEAGVLERVVLQGAHVGVGQARESHARGVPAHGHGRGQQRRDGAAADGHRVGLGGLAVRRRHLHLDRVDAEVQVRPGNRPHCRRRRSASSRRRRGTTPWRRHRSWSRRS